MSGTARIIVISGPGRGRSFEPDEELVHIGKGPENHIVIEDPSLADHQASIVRRNGRYAIFTPLADAVEVDGSIIPAERWVWLPESVKVQLGQRTTFVFTCEEEAAEDEGDGNGDPEPAEAANARGSERRRSEGRAEGGAAVATRTPAESKVSASPLKAKPRSKRKKKSKHGHRSSEKKREVAQFITAQGGDTLVKLGEDGHMPELMLMEGPSTGKKKEKTAKEANPAMLYVALAVSILMSMAMLFIETGGGTSSYADKSTARQQIKKFYGGNGKLKPYQQHLRNAELAHYRRDFPLERKEYRKVLDLLNAEDNNRFTGLTGNPEDDKELKRLISILLGG